jgi:hypothetical protein
MGPLKWCAVALIGLSCAVAHAAPPGEDEEDLSEEGDGAVPMSEEHPGSLYAEAQRQLQALRTTSYSHDISIDEHAGRFDYDCSGFVSYALARIDRAALKQVRDEPGRRPLAKHYEAFFSRLSPLGAGHWEPVKTVDALERGDVVAWKKPAASHSKNTGHVVIVAGAPVRRSEGEYVVPIIDSTALPHGHTDLRWGRATGLGTGNIVLITDAQGRPEGFRWTVKSHRRWETRVSMGRLRR